MCRRCRLDFVCSDEDSRRGANYAEDVRHPFAPLREIVLLGAPAPDGTRVEVDEIRPLVVPHTSAGELHRGVSYVSGRKIGEANIDGLTRQVQAVFGDATGVCAEHLIRARRTVSAQDIESRVRVPKVGLNVVEQIEQLRIHGDGIARSKISKEMVQLLQGWTLITVSNTIGDRDALVRVEMSKG